MSTVKEIELAIRQLSPKDVAELTAWLAEYDAALWDKKFAVTFKRFAATPSPTKP